MLQQYMLQCPNDTTVSVFTDPASEELMHCSLWRGSILNILQKLKKSTKIVFLLSSSQTVSQPPVLFLDLKDPLLGYMEVPGHTRVTLDCIGCIGCIYSSYFGPSVCKGYNLLLNWGSPPRQTVFTRT